jgi:hypothetical protein
MIRSAAALAERLHYPALWIDRGLYPEALYRVQLAAFESEARQRGIASAEYQPAGAEHYRYGAFTFWLQQKPDAGVADALMEAAIADPDPRMASAVMNDLLAGYRLSPAVVELAIKAIRQSGRYAISADALESYLRHGRARPEAAPGPDAVGDGS